MISYANYTHRYIHHIGKYLFKLLVVLNFLYEAEHQMFKEYSCAGMFFPVVHELFVPPVKIIMVDWETSPSLPN